MQISVDLYSLTAFPLTMSGRTSGTSEIVNTEMIFNWLIGRKDLHCAGYGSLLCSAKLAACISSRNIIARYSETFLGSHALYPEQRSVHLRFHLFAIGRVKLWNLILTPLSHYQNIGLRLSYLPADTSMLSLLELMCFLIYRFVAAKWASEHWITIPTGLEALAASTTLWNRTWSRVSISA